MIKKSNKNSIKPNIWGSYGWKFIHYVALGYPINPTDNDKINYKNFFTNLQYILPCQKCASNFKKNITEYPIDNHLENQDTLMKWTIDIHNMVNKELNKEIISYEEALNYYIYDHSYLDHIKKCSKLFYLLFSIIIILIIYIFIK
jgi:hypothetical protein